MNDILDKIIQDEFKIHEEIYSKFLANENEQNRELVQQSERFLKNLYCIKHNTNEADRVGYINFLIKLKDNQK